MEETSAIRSDLMITLAAARTNAGLTQRQAAELIGVSKATILSWEKGKTTPTVLQADKLCEIYHRPKDSIIF